MIAEDERRLAMLKLRIQGWTYKRIAQKYGVSKERIRQLIFLPLWISEVIREERISGLSGLEHYFHPDLSMERRQRSYEIAKRALD